MTTESPRLNEPSTSRSVRVAEETAAFSPSAHAPGEASELTATLPAEPCSDIGRAEALADRLREHSRSIIDQERERLARKAPTLSEADLRVVGRALDELVDRILVARVRTAPERGDQLRYLFGLAS